MRNSDETRNLLRLLFFIFHRKYCAAVGVKEKHKVPFDTFLAWLREQLELLKLDSTYAERRRVLNGREFEEADVPITTWHRLEDLAFVATDEDIRESWLPFIVLGAEPAPECDIDSVTLMWFTRFSDGKIATHKAFLDKSNMQKSEKIDISTLALFTTKVAKNFVETCVSYTLNRIHADSRVFGDSILFENMLRLTLANFLSLSNLPAETVERMRLYFELCMAVIRSAPPPAPGTAEPHK